MACSLPPLELIARTRNHSWQMKTTFGKQNEVWALYATISFHTLKSNRLQHLVSISKLSQLDNICKVTFPSVLAAFSCRS
jgi:hypothetical protein